MPHLIRFFEFFIHLDLHLDNLLNLHPNMVYTFLFLVIFLEMALLFLSFLPGDSLLFIAGSFAARGSIDFLALLIVFTVAAIAGNIINFWLGYWLGPKFFRSEKGFLFNKERIHQAHLFFEKHGGLALILSFFVPILRTIASFAAGIAEMDFKKFMSFNLAGSFIWILSFLTLGFWFGKIPIVRDNMSAALLIAGLVILILVPIIIQIVKFIKKRTKPAN